jgi:hypothetical protein
VVVPVVAVKELVAVRVPGVVPVVARSTNVRCVGEGKRRKWHRNNRTSINLCWKDRKEEKVKEEEDVRRARSRRGQTTIACNTTIGEATLAVDHPLLPVSVT